MPAGFLNFRPLLYLPPHVSPTGRSRVILDLGNLTVEPLIFVCIQ